MAKKFPEALYVRLEYDGDTPWFNVLDNGPKTIGIEKSTEVAVYHLVEVGKVRVTREYESPTNGKKARA